MCFYQYYAWDIEYSKFLALSLNEKGKSLSFMDPWIEYGIILYHNILENSRDAIAVHLTPNWRKDILFIEF